MKEEWEASEISTTEKDGVRGIVSSFSPDTTAKPERIYKTRLSKTLDIRQQNKQSLSN